MFNNIPHHQSSPRTIYYPAFRRHLWFMLSPMALVVLLNASSLAEHVQWTNVLGFVASVFTIMFWLYMARTVRLITSPAGIEYHTPGYHVHTTWDNTERIEFVRMWYGGEQEGLILRYSALSGNTWLGWTSPLYRQGRIIPLISGGWVHYTQLEQELRHYAPHLFGHNTLSKNG